MNPDLQRIEATLNQLDYLKAVGTVPTSMRSGSRPYQLPPLVKPRSPARPVQTTGEQSTPKVLSLPPVNSGHSGGTGRGATSLVYLLREIEATANSWQDELIQVGRDIAQLYDEGPIVDGWLEGLPDEATGESNKLRHVDVTQLMDYVEEICNSPESTVKGSPSREGYRLCGLDEDGKFWSRPCPPEQVPSVSVAIARYHRLKQLLERQQFLETRLNQLTETLGALHHHLHH